MPSIKRMAAKMPKGAKNEEVMIAAEMDYPGMEKMAEEGGGDMEDILKDYSDDELMVSIQARPEFLKKLKGVLMGEEEMAEEPPMLA